MSKILLVEDDNNLREIYEARLKAEGYDIVAAHDGEEALVIAKAEKPDLVISDVMMPKISGFEMLDILRNTAGLQSTKVIMLTALGQSDDQHRAEKLGADRYLVKSQVTLEDIVIAANELLNGAQAPSEDLSSVGQIGSPPAQVATTNSPATAAPAQDFSSANYQPADTAEMPPVMPMPVAPNPSSTPTEPSTQDNLAPISMPSNGLQVESTSQEEKEVQSQINGFMNGQAETSQPEDLATPPTVTAQPVATPVNTPVAGMRVIEPLPSNETKTDINQLLQMTDNNIDKPSGMAMSNEGIPPAPVPVTDLNSPATDSSADPENIAL